MSKIKKIKEAVMGGNPFHEEKKGMKIVKNLNHDGKIYRVGQLVTEDNPHYEQLKEFNKK